MLRIKICGITTTADALATVAAGADAIGLNFYGGSKRYVAPEMALEITTAVGSTAVKVGVFVNSSADEVNQIAGYIGLDWVQLHGDETAEFLNLVSPDKKILRVYRLATSDLTPVTTDLAACRTAGRLPDAILIDSAVPGEYGGTGKQGVGLFVTPRKAKSPDPFYSLPFLLAGGLTPENVAESIRKSCPDGVDVASGVESEPGVKDSEKVKRFISESIQAFGHLPN